jgi:hypothetical protein
MSSYNRLGECSPFPILNILATTAQQPLADLSASELRNLFVYSGATVAG